MPTDPSPAEQRLDAALTSGPPARWRATEPRRFLVSTQRPDGVCANRTATGGITGQHAQDAMEAAGLGSVVRVLPWGDDEDAANDGTRVAPW